MYDVLLIAKYIIKYCNKSNLSISNLKLQKLLYFIQAAFLVERGQPCFSDEIEAWDFGPVVPAVYYKYKIYGGTNIPYVNNNETLFVSISKADKDIIDRIINDCAKYTASMLVDITHKQTPWLKAYAPYTRNIITKDSIMEFFKEV
ncbi:MAG: DUF4065 domain-containing protein [Synergistaceae bacterium]|nr:DUF4065 domain-containing protein [Synergistaceae bacterium]